MAELPDFAKAFSYENDFYLSCDNSRLAKMLAHYEAYRMIVDVPGAIVECGVFKGVSLIRFAAFRALFGQAGGRRIVGFDSFGQFPPTADPQDAVQRERFIAAAGSESLSADQLRAVLARKGADRDVDLIAGDVVDTVPRFVADEPAFKAALINLDTDTLEPAEAVFEHLYPRLARGGVLLIDNYGVFPGETRIADAFAREHGLVVRRFPFAATPCYVVKP